MATPSIGTFVYYHTVYGNGVYVDAPAYIISTHDQWDNGFGTNQPAEDEVGIIWLHWGGAYQGPTNSTEGTAQGQFSRI